MREIHLVVFQKNKRQAPRFPLLIYRQAPRFPLLIYRLLQSHLIRSMDNYVNFQDTLKQTYNTLHFFLQSHSHCHFTYLILNSTITSCLSRNVIIISSKVIHTFYTKIITGNLDTLSNNPSFLILLQNYN